MVVGLGLPLLLAACGDRGVTTERPVASYTATTPPVPGAAAGYSRQGQLLARLQQPATTGGAVTDAHLDNRGTLTVALDPKIKLAQVQPLLRNLMQQMQAAMPDQALTVVATGPYGTRLASLHYDPMQPAPRDLAYQEFFKTNQKG